VYEFLSTGYASHHAHLIFFVEKYTNLLFLKDIFQEGKFIEVLKLQGQALITIAIFANCIGVLIAQRNFVRFAKRYCHKANDLSPHVDTVLLHNLFANTDHYAHRR
jgi:hypothetical protein